MFLLLYKEHTIYIYLFIFLGLYSREDNLVNGTNEANEPLKDLD